MTIESRYLGDAVYASYKNGMVMLTTNHHEEDKAKQVIWLEEEVAIELVKYIDSIVREHWI